MTTRVAARIASVTTPDWLGSVDEDPLVALALRRLDGLADRAQSAFERRLAGAPQPVPERQRPLRVGIDQ